MQEIEFEIDRDGVERYFRTTQSLLWLLLISIFGLGLILALIHYYKFGRWLCPQQANNLRYRLEGNMLRVDSGVFFLSRKSIPLERIADITLAQGPLQRHFGIWTLWIQQAGFGRHGAILFGVCEPEKVRDLILSHCKNVDSEKTEDA